MVRLLAPILLLLTACNAPGAYFRDAPVMRVAVEGSQFDVRVRGRLAEAIRVNPQYAPRFGPIRKRAATAMMLASRCKVKEVHGDGAQATGLLDCGQGETGPDFSQISLGYDCVEVDRWASTGQGVEYTEFECEPR